MARLNAHARAANVAEGAAGPGRAPAAATPQGPARLAGRAAGSAQLVSGVGDMAPPPAGVPARVPSQGPGSHRVVEAPRGNGKKRRPPCAAGRGGRRLALGGAHHPARRPAGERVPGALPGHPEPPGRDRARRARNGRGDGVQHGRPRPLLPARVRRAAAAAGGAGGALVPGGQPPHRQRRGVRAPLHGDGLRPRLREVRGRHAGAHPPAPGPGRPPARHPPVDERGRGRHSFILVRAHGRAGGAGQLRARAPRGAAAVEDGPRRRRPARQRRVPGHAAHLRGPSARGE
jgi:hypothetical protein